MTHSKSPDSNSRSGRWTTVTSERKCRICEKADWCAFADDGGAEICRRLAVDGAVHRVDSSGFDYWLYCARGRREHEFAYRAKSAVPTPDPDTLHAAYGALLSMLTLSPEHAADLQRRGMSAERITRDGYRTMPKAGRRAIARRLIEKLGEAACRSVPGLAAIETDGRSEWKLFGRAGLIVPVRDLEGRVVALKVRRDDEGLGDDGSNRYSYVSSRKHGGTGPGAPLHVPLGVVGPFEEGRITEGEIKAVVAYDRTGLPTLSIPGVSSWRKALPALRALGVRRVRLAFDVDAQSIPNVARALECAASALVDEGFDVALESWDPALGKGIDDALVAGGEVSCTSFEQPASTAEQPEVAPLLDRIKALTRGEGEEWPALLDRLTDAGILEEIIGAAGRRRFCLEALAATLQLSDDERKDFNDAMRHAKDEAADEKERDVCTGRATESSSADALIAIATECDLFHDDAKDAFALIMVRGHRELHAIQSSSFKEWLANEHYKRSGGAASDSSVGEALRVISAKAKFEGPCREVYVRVARDAGGVWYDLCDDQWRAVRITPTGWSIVERPPVLFRRFANAKPQVNPQRGGRLADVFSFVHVKEGHPRQLALTWLVAGLIPGSPRYVLALTGEQGTAKSTGGRLLRRLIDPAKAASVRIARKTEELAQTLAHSWLIFFDNLSRITDETSDALCSAVTGDGLSKRRLYTNDEDQIFEFRRLLLMSGIGEFYDRADLLDRMLIVRLEPFTKEEIKAEEEILAAFEAELPRLFGALLDVVASTLRDLPSAKNVPGIRMADFSRIGVAAERHLGFSAGSFAEAIAMNSAAQVEEAIEASVIGPILWVFAEKNETWKGTASELLDQLNASIEGDPEKKKQPGWPKNYVQLGITLSRLAPVMRKVGVDIRRRREAGGKTRVVEISFTKPSSSSASSETEFRP